MPDSIEELQQRLAGTTDTIEKLDLMIELAYKTRRSDPAGAHRLASKALRLARSRKDALRIARCTMILGFCEYFQADYSIALERFQQASELAEKSSDALVNARIHYGLGITYLGIVDCPKAMESLRHALDLVEADRLAELLGHVHNGIAMVYARLSDFPKALEHYRRSLEGFEVVHDTAGAAMVFNNIGNAYRTLGHFEPAAESFARSNALAIENNDLRTQGATTVNLGELLHRQGKPEEAIVQYLRALELSKVLDDADLEAKVLSSMGSIHINKIDGDLDAAYSLCQQAVEIAERIENGMLWQFKVRVGEVHHARMEYDRALECYNRALEGVRAQGDRFSEYQILSRLSLCYEEMGELAEAFRYHKLYMTLKEEVVGQQQQEEMMQFRLRMELEHAEKDRQILRLEKQSLEQAMAYRMKELTATALHVVKKNEFLDSLKREIAEVVRIVDGKVRPALRGLLRQVDARINDMEDWEVFEKQFFLAHHDFLHDLSQRCPTLTKTELKVCALLKLDLTTKEIANILSTSVKTVESHRYHIRKKLDIPLETKLTAYLAAF
jgi:tetratricopeptide (TPR) repeat protein/DNA-binding CsgD family transcriptional regulator